MGRKRVRAPLWVQWLIVWTVVSGLAAAGFMFLRSRGVVGDAVFQPLVPLLCEAGAHIETSYSSRANLVNNRGQSTPFAGRQQVSTGLDRASCVYPDGRESPIKGRFTALVLGLFGLAGAAVVGLLAMSRRR